MSNPLMLQTDFEILIDNITDLVEDESRLRAAFAGEIMHALHDGRSAVLLLRKIAPFVDESTRGEVVRFLSDLERK